MNEVLKSVDVAGATILALAVEEYYGVAYPVLRVRTRSGRNLKLIVQSDEEGNRGGFVAFEEVARCPVCGGAGTVRGADLGTCATRNLGCGTCEGTGQARD
jgi:hypothetical protein